VTRVLSTLAFTIVAMLFTIVATGSHAHAACGDTILDAGEACDDGNTQAGDCCSATCTYEPIGSSCDHGIAGMCYEALAGFCNGAGACLPFGCRDYSFYFGATHAELMIRDDAGEDADRVNWFLLSPHDHDYLPPAPPGDPTVDTTYALCVYEIAEMPGGYDYVANVRYENVFGAGPGWKKVANGYNYYAKTPAGGSVKLRIRPLTRLAIRGAAAELPGPVSGTAYFGRIIFGLVNTAGYCGASGSFEFEGEYSRKSYNVPTGFRVRNRFPVG
jgi:cysteine-rich repeat protein